MSYTADDAPMTATVEIHLSFLHPLTDLCIRPLANAARLIQRSKDHLLLLFWLVAAGMDMNNLGHSAALSGALVMSEVTLGTSFKIGFTLHNITKALAMQH